MRSPLLAILLTPAVLLHAARAQDAAPRVEKAEGGNAETQDKPSIEEWTRVHRLSSTKRSVFDAFVYVNRIPERPEEGESVEDFAGRIFGRLANQEGRILLKAPHGMDLDTYVGLKTFLRFAGESSVGNCVACHTPPEFSDLKTRVVANGGSPRPTPSLRNLDLEKGDIRNAILAKIAASQQKQAGDADEIDDAYNAMRLDEKDVASLAAFLAILQDVSDEEFRSLILNAALLDTTQDLNEDPSQTTE